MCFSSSGLARNSLIPLHQVTRSSRKRWLFSCFVSTMASSMIYPLKTAKFRNLSKFYIVFQSEFFYTKINMQQKGISKMAQNLTSTLAQQSEQPETDTVTLWHATNDADTLKSFWDEGAKPIGIGRGGQRGVFFVWSKKKGANSHFSDFLATDSYNHDTATEGLIIGTQIKKNDLTYPNWQFDLETGKVLNPLLFQYREQITNIKNLEYVDEYGDKISISSINLTPITTEDACTLKFVKGPTGRVMRIGETGLAYLELWQALIDKLCENPDFRKDYNKTLQKAASHPSANFALKYCGEQPLPVDEAFYIQKDESGKVTETQLYTSSVPKEKQVCPFVKMGMAKKKVPGDLNLILLLAR